VLVALDLLQVPYTRVDQGQAFGLARVHAVNVAGKIPTIIDQNVAIWESNTIVRYVFAKFGPTVDVAAAALRSRWMDFQLGTVEPDFKTVFLTLVRTPHDQINEAALGAAVAAVHEHFRVLEAAYTDKKWLESDDAPTNADVPFVGILHRYYSFAEIKGFKRAEWPNLRRVYEQWKAIPAYQKHVLSVPVS